MLNYKESSIAGQQFERAYKIEISNPLGGMPSIRYSEETAVVLPTQTVTTHTGTMDESFGDGTTAFPLLNPTDDSVIGQAHYVDLQVILYSLHRFLAARRDAAAT